MTVSTLEQKRAIAIKSHQCVWCGHPVLVGSRYERQKIIIDGSFQSNAWHEACLVGFDDHWKETREEEFEPCEHDMPFFALYQLETSTPSPKTNLRVRSATADDVNKAFDPANEALGGAFQAGFREGWIYAEIDADGERYQEMAEEYALAVDIAPQEAWDAHRGKFFAMLPLAAIPEVGAPIADIEAEIASVVQSVNEWDDRTSPDDYPDHLLITSEELADILRNFAATLEGSAE